MPSNWPKWLLTIGLAALALYGASTIDASALVTLAATLSSIAASLAGIIFAAITVLIAAGDRKLIQNMRKTGHYATLLRELYVSIDLYLVAFVLTLAVLFLPDDSLRTIAYIGIVFFVAATVFVVWAGAKFRRLLDYL